MHRRAACDCCGRRGGRRILRVITAPGGPRRSPVPTVRGRVLVEMVSDLVLDAATLRVEGDPLVEQLARSQDTVDLQERRTELESLRTAVLGDRAAAEELITEYQSELSRADEQVFRLEADLELERDLRARFEQAYLTIATGGIDPSPPGPSASTNGNLSEVVRRAKAQRSHLVILPEAERSAAEWHYDRGDLVEQDLARLDSVAGRWASGALQGDFATACREQGLDWVRDVERVRQAEVHRGLPAVVHGSPDHARPPFSPGRAPARPGVLLPRRGRAPGGGGPRRPPPARPDHHLVTLSRRVRPEVSLYSAPLGGVTERPKVLAC